MASSKEFPIANIVNPKKVYSNLKITVNEFNISINILDKK